MTWETNPRGILRWILSDSVSTSRSRRKEQPIPSSIQKRSEKMGFQRPLDVLFCSHGSWILNLCSHESWHWFEHPLRKPMCFAHCWVMPVDTGAKPKKGTREQLLHCSSVRCSNPTHAKRGTAVERKTRKKQKAGLGLVFRYMMLNAMVLNLV